MRLTTKSSTRDTSGPVVSHIENLSIWWFSVGDEHTSYKIWSKSVLGLSRNVQTMRTDNARDYGRPVPKFNHVCTL
jgi:hypothetical protein